MSVTAFQSSYVDVVVQGLEWKAEETNGLPGQPNSTLSWATSVEGVTVASGTYDLADFGHQLPTTLRAGQIQVSERGRVEITVTLTLNDDIVAASTSIQVYLSVVALVPLVVLIGLTLCTKMVEFSLFTAILLGGCIVEGQLINGFKTALDSFILVGDSWLFNASQSRVLTTIPA
jgi:hypothetical protein